ncbi:hypothetical protein [Kingella oralis]|uniref:hypothetical protein n=1 Tax=Kingella oralis TaxID=505 RepID=UPI0034E538F4
MLNAFVLLDRLDFRLPYRVNKGSLKIHNGALATRRHLGNPRHPIQHPLGNEPLLSIFRLPQIIKAA